MAMPDFLKCPDLPRCKSDKISVFSSSQKIHRSADKRKVLFNIICGSNADMSYKVKAYKIENYSTNIFETKKKYLLYVKITLMNETKTTTGNLDFAEGENPTLPSGLNVLTILTFVGSAIALITSVLGYTNAEKSYKQIVDSQAKLAEAPAWAKGMMGPNMVEMAKKSMENKLPVLLLGIVATALCIYGAIEMRKLKKQGFILWVVGEILPIITSVLFLGIGVFSGFGLIGLVIPIIFIILYAVQRKYLIY